MAKKSPAKKTVSRKVATKAPVKSANKRKRFILIDEFKPMHGMMAGGVLVLLKAILGISLVIGVVIFLASAALYAADKLQNKK